MFICVYCAAQQMDPSYRKFSDTTFSTNVHQFYILQISNSATPEFKNRLTLVSVRKLSDSVFIVDRNVFQSFSDKSFIKKSAPANNQWKLSPSVDILSMASRNLKITRRFTIQIKSKVFLDELFAKQPEFKQKISILAEQNIISLVTNYQQIQKLFLNDPRVLFIDVVSQNPKEESAISGFDLSANKINVVHSQYPLINGLGQHVSIKEDYFDTTDIDLKGRYDSSPLASKNISNHANFMATIIVGGGNSIWYAKGAAWQANVSSSSFEAILPDADAYYKQQNITVQNHSYGTVVENNYGLNAVAFDKSANDNQDLLHVFSSGNSGTSISSGMYSGVAGFANLTGNFKMAKNILTVGAVDSFGNVAPLSSRGPAYDGRIKPELVAFQKNGTSEAAALVSGTALLLQQYYKIENKDSVLPSALVKAILINSADDVNNPGPDYATGFGNLNAIKAMEVIKNKHLIKGEISQGATQSFSINIPEKTTLLKVTLSWNDPAASALIPKALVNDVDLEVTLPTSNTSWRPWVLSSVANPDSLNSLAKRKRDSLNNVEEITIPNPLAGNYKINITGYNLPTGTQKYYVAYSFDTLNSFKWQRPLSLDFAQGNDQNILRWENSFSENGTIEYSYIPFTTWLPVASNVNLSKNYFYWNAPDTVSQALLRMKIGNNHFYSDTFLITTLLNPKVGFICSDSILVYWNKIKGINRYQLYGLGNKLMEPIMEVADTSVILLKNKLTDKFIAVAPILEGGEIAPKSYAFNYTLQGSSCYINAFLVDANGKDARLTLNMGTLYNVDSISFEKQSNSGFLPIYSSASIDHPDFIYHYDSLTTGITYFRAKVILSDGQIIYSQPQSVFYVAPGKYLLLPVPASRNTDISLYTATPDEEIISVFDVMGRIVLQKEILSAHEIIKTAGLQKGEYFYRISKKGVKVYSGKLIIL
jgi:hypothetical protein